MSDGSMPDSATAFAQWYNEGKPIPVMHPIPWVYAEVYFTSPERVEWRLYDYAADEYTVEEYRIVDSETGPLPRANDPDEYGE